MRAIIATLLLTTAFLTACAPASPETPIVIPTLMTLPTVTLTPDPLITPSITPTRAPTVTPTVPLQLTTCRLFYWWSDSYDPVVQFLDDFTTAYSDADQRVPMTLRLNNAPPLLDQNYIEDCSVDAAFYWGRALDFMLFGLRRMIEQGDSAAQPFFDEAALYLYALYSLDPTYAPLPLTTVSEVWGGTAVNSETLVASFATSTANVATWRVEWTATAEGRFNAPGTALINPRATMSFSNPLAETMNARRANATLTAQANPPPVSGG